MLFDAADAAIRTLENFASRTKRPDISNLDFGG